MKKRIKIASLFIILTCGIFAGKLISNISLDAIKEKPVLVDSKLNNSRIKDNMASKDLTTIINGNTSSIDTEKDGIGDNITIIDDISDFALMNGSSGHFKLSKNISVPNSITSLGIETFDGVFNGGGYTISNLKGPFVNNLTGTICNFIIDSPREFNAVLDASATVKHTIYDTLYGFTTDNSYTQVAPQYFGFACGIATGGTIDNVKVNNAKINTNGSTEGEFDTSINTTGYMGFIAGQINQITYLTNCSVTNSTLVHSSAYAVGGIVGHSNFSYVKGCLVNNLSVTGKNGLAINTMPKAFTGLLVGANYRGTIDESIVTNITQTSTPYLSFLGAALYIKNTGTTNIRNIYYDKTVADFSKAGMDEGYEQIIQITNDPINSSNATVDNYGHVYDIDESSVGYYRTLVIKDIHRYSSTSLSSIISEYNSNLKLGGYSLKRNPSTYNIDNYVAEDEKVIAVNFSISDDLTYGDYFKDKVTLQLDTSKTNFETEVFFQYKYEGSNYFLDLTDESIVTKLTGEYRILYTKNGSSYVLEGASGTFNAKPFDLKDAVINVSSHKYNGKEQEVFIVVRTPSGLSITPSLSGTTSATEVGVYDVVITGNSNATGSVTTQWEIKPGTMSLYANNIETTYDDNYHSIKVSAPDNTILTYSTDGVEYTSTNPSFKDVGTYTVYYKASNPNYEDVSGFATITIKPRVVKLIWGETSLVYNGEEQVPSVTLGNIQGDDVVNITAISGYAIEKGNTYTATVLGVDNPNYILPSEVSINFKITPIIVEVPSISSKEYTGEILYADVDENDGYVIEGIYYGTTVGQYKFTLSPKYNYAWPGGSTYKLSYTFEITKGTNEWVIAPSIEDWTYGQQASELIYQSKFGIPTIRYYAEGSEEVLSGVPTEAGNYKVEIINYATYNYDGELHEILSFTIHKANSTSEAPTYLTTPLGSTLNDIALPIDENGIWSFVEDGKTSLDEAKEYTFTLIFTPNDTKNYNTIEKEVTINVPKIDVAYTAPTIVSQLTYNGNKQALINAGITNDGIFEYKLDDGEYSTNIPTAKDAKTYTVYYRIIGDKNHNDVDEQSLQVSISPLKVNILNVNISDVHINETGYDFIASNVVFDTELTVDDYEITSMTLTGNNEGGIQEVEVIINVKNDNYELISNTLTTTVNIIDHEANLDDGDCTTPVTCKHCDYVFVDGHLEHESHEDDNDCTTPVKCRHCNYVLVEAHLEHESEEDDNDCTTPVTCKHCDYVFAEAHLEHEGHEDDNNCETEVTCKHCKTIVVEAKKHNLSSSYTKDVEGHYTHCENETCEYVTIKENHTSNVKASEENAEVCTTCDYVIAQAIVHTHSNSDSLSYDETHHFYICDGCDEQLEKIEHSYTIVKKIDETSHKEICVCGKEQVATHTYGDWVVEKNPSETEKGSKTKTCSCGHVIIEDIPATYLTNPSVEPTKGLPVGAIICIVIGSVILLGLGIFAILWFVVKKRNFSDLVKLFKNNNNTR